MVLLLESFQVRWHNHLRLCHPMSPPTFSILASTDSTMSAIFGWSPPGCAMTTIRSEKHRIAWACRASEMNTYTNNVVRHGVRACSDAGIATYCTVCWIICMCFADDAACRSYVDDQLSLGWSITDKTDNLKSSNCHGQTFRRCSAPITSTTDFNICYIDCQCYADCYCLFAGISVYSWSMAHICTNRRSMGHWTAFWSPGAYADCPWSEFTCILSSDFGASSSRLQKFQICFSRRTASDLSLCLCDGPHY